MVFICFDIGLITQLIFWLTPDVVAKAVVVNLHGFVIARFFPTGLTIIMKLFNSGIRIIAWVSIPRPTLHNVCEVSP
ncbi:hypothetical protein IMZ48_02625 [Candidatus Bathyarchaeota archaeon]|nr:hypothetical protein [Candidatus Bathyarchaeota archaeon]